MKKTIFKAKTNKVSKKRTEVIGYLTLIGWLYATVFSENRHECSSHLSYALVVNLALTCYIPFLIISAYMHVVDEATIIMIVLVGVASLAWILGIISAALGKEPPIKLDD